MAKINVERAFLVADPVGDQVYITLCRRLWIIIDLIESLYGPRDKRWTIMGVEYYPIQGHLSYHGDRSDRIMVRLPLDTIHDPIETYHYLAHECVHLLAPEPIITATALEEGLCETFAMDYVKKHWGTKISCQSAKYARFERMVRELLAIDPDAIRKLRRIEPAFSKMRPEHLCAAVPAISDQLVSDLLAPAWAEGEFEQALAEGQFTPPHERAGFG